MASRWNLTEAGFDNLKTEMDFVQQGQCDV